MLKLTTAPTVDPVTTSEAKAHARIYASFTGDDATIADLVSAARIKFEKETGYFLSQATYEWSPRCGYTCMRLPLRPVITDTLTITDGEDNLTEDDVYSVAIDKDGFALVEFDVAPAKPVFTFQVGFANPTGSASHGAPALAKLAIKTLVAHWYNNREAFSADALGPVAGAWESVIRDYRIA